MSDIRVSIENAGPCRKTLTIEVPAAEVDGHYKKLLDLYSRSARIPGFRPGKAPAALVERHYGKEIREELKDQLLAFGYRRAMEQEKLRPVAAVDVTDETPVLVGSPFSYKVTVDLPPEFETPVYKGLPIAEQKIEVTDAQVEESIAQFRERMARYQEVKDRPSAAGDIVRIDFTGRVGDRPVEEIAPDGSGIAKGTDFWLRTDETAEASFLPGMGQAVLGLNPGDVKDIPVAFPSDYPTKELAGQSALYTVTVKEIREKTLPPMDEEFFKMAGVATLEEFRARVVDSLRRAAERNEEERRSNEAIRMLLERAKIEALPQTEVQSETQQIVMNIVRENTMRGVASETIKEQRDGILNAATRSADERVKLGYILDRIAEAEKIEVTEGEVNGHLGVLAARRRESLAKLREEFEKKGRMADLVRDLRNEKALAFVVKQASVPAA